jgi:hypothetical protein
MHDFSDNLPNRNLPFDIYNHLLKIILQIMYPAVLSIRIRSVICKFTNANNYTKYLKGIF